MRSRPFYKDFGEFAQVFFFFFIRKGEEEDLDPDQKKAVARAVRLIENELQERFG